MEDGTSDMQKIIKFPEPEKPHKTGKAVCLACGNEWVAVSPIGTVWLECPECKTVKGLEKFTCVRETSHWECNCGNDLFHATPDGFYCPKCGAWANGF